MNMTNVQTENGYVVQGDLLCRMHRFRPSKGDFYHMAKLPNRDFAQIGIMVTIKSDEHVKYRLFEIYAGNEELYEHIRTLFVNTAKALDCPAKSEDWESNMPKFRRASKEFMEMYGKRNDTP